MKKEEKNDPTEPERPVMDFAEFVETLSNGEVNRHLGEKLSEVIAAVKDTKKGGKLVVELAIKPEAHLAKIEVAVKTTIPQPPLPGTIMFFRGDTALSREDPKQLQINLREISTKPVEVRDIDKKSE